MEIPSFRLKASLCQQMFSFCSLVRFDVSWGSSACFLIAVSERAMSVWYLTDSYQRDLRLDPFLICSHPQAETPPHPRPSLCCCFLCIETQICFSLSPPPPPHHKELHFHFVYLQIHGLLWRSQDKKLCRVLLATHKFFFTGC